VVTDIEHKLLNRRQDDFALENAEKRLNEKNHSLVDTDAEYAATTRKLSSERNTQIADLTRKLHELEEELEKANKIKTSSFHPFTKRAKTQRVAEMTGKVEIAKKDLATAVRNFEIKQEKLHDEYEKKKEARINEVQKLEREVDNLEKDNSTEDRKTACEALVSAIEELIQRSKS
jgi:hypothetical protein